MVLGASFSSACWRKNSWNNIASVVGSAAAIVVAPAFANSYFWSSSVRRFASASTASCLLANPTSPINRRSCRVEAGALNMYRQTVFPDRYLRLNIGISSPPLPLVGVEVQRPPDDRRCAPRPGTRARSEEHTSELQSLRHL